MMTVHYNTLDASKILPREGVILARVNYPLDPERIKKWANAKHLLVTTWNITLDEQEYVLIINGDHRLAAAIEKGRRPRYVKPAPEFRAAFWKRALDEQLMIIRTWGGGSPEWINALTGERIEALS